MMKSNFSFRNEIVTPTLTGKTETLWFIFKDGNLLKSSFGKNPSYTASESLMFQRY